MHFQTGIYVFNLLRAKILINAENVIVCLCVVCVQFNIIIVGIIKNNK